MLNTQTKLSTQTTILQKSISVIFVWGMIVVLVLTSCWMKTTPIVKLHLQIPPIRSLVTFNSSTNALEMDYFPNDCPIPKMGLVGVFTTTKRDSEHRHVLLREHYRKINANLSIGLQFDIKFVYGDAKNWENEYELATNELLFPDDTIVLEQEENMDDGKTLQWFLYARDMMYEKHPTRETICPRYRFIGKTDEDTIIHLPRLSNILNKLPKNQSHYVGSELPLDVPFVVEKFNFQKSPNGSFMIGMLYLLTIDIVEWIKHSPIPLQHTKGYEDRMVGTWLREGNLSNTVNYAHQHGFHFREEITYAPHGRATPDSVAIHFCKTSIAFHRCLCDLYGSPTSTVKRILSAKSIEKHKAPLEKMFPQVKNVTLPDNIPITPESDVGLQLIAFLLKPVIAEVIPNYIRDPVSDADLMQILLHLAARVEVGENSWKYTPDDKVSTCIWRALAALGLRNSTRVWETKVADKLNETAQNKSLSWSE
ncbi:hypothetical protein BCR33DRAFT_396235 [Rhizoclosmatium globosum]|uniref:Hexosyltransferase n=1 Tax=Rhizoclosmatium globosum TaxID=329046 RepID=A0A1Y2CY32_9FUNG|nr:hypothetical protein BCR33DRAFT_396235 [Rhizoclosmatium globosum]|eukprot:ORY51796.1 hypothetical protein BCR33DRAFT_396235 [Rhizoclosmatium globosum]